MSEYRFKQPAPRQAGFEPLPPGDYQFVVTDIDEPYRKSSSGNLVLPVQISILPDQVKIFCNPWTGIDRNGEERDGISEFILAVGRAPEPGREPEWRKLVGARGKCRLKQEKVKQGALEGKMVNKVHFFYTPNVVGPSAGKQSFSKEEYAKGQKQTEQKAGGSGEEPDDIPF